jgi:hypothetical protein
MEGDEDKLDLDLNFLDKEETDEDDEDKLEI